MRDDLGLGAQETRLALTPSEVAAKRGIELGGFLEGHSVTRIFEAKHFGVRNPLGQSIGLGGSNQDVLARPHQKRWQID